MPSKRKFLIVFGTRPEAIKLAPLIIEFQRLNKEFEFRTCVTAQHRDMLDQALMIFNIKPDYDLNIMKPGQSLCEITREVLSGVTHVIDSYNPTHIIVHGDTSTTFAASLAAFYKRVPVIHIEAGLRSGDKYSPWPEEANRFITSYLSSLHFAPTEESKINLLKEGVHPETIYVTGNTVVDSLKLINERLTLDKNLQLEFADYFKFIDFSKKIVLVTGHRRENFGDTFVRICEAIANIARFDNVEIVYPVHLNPSVRAPVNLILGNIKNVHLIEPVDYFKFVYLMGKAYFILTDSGGIQEEAPALSKPVLVIRDTTERPEGVNSGVARLVGTDPAKIIENAKMLINDMETYNTMSSSINPYGDGKASNRIISALRTL